VARDDDGKPYSVRYEAVNAMLLNEFLKEHRQVEAEGNEIGNLKATVTELISALKAQAAEIQKINACLVRYRAASNVVVAQSAKNPSER